MNLELHFINADHQSSTVAGLAVLDLVRQVIPNANLTEIKPSVYVDLSSRIDITEDLARKSSWFNNDWSVYIRVRATDERWLTWMSCTQAKTTPEGLMPIIQVDHTELLQAWIDQNFPAVIDLTADTTDTD